MQPHLENLADIRVGLTLRGRDASLRTDQGGLHLLRISDISEDGQLRIETPNRLDPAIVDDSRFRVKPGDILLANRGSRMTAAIVPHGLEATAGGQLFIIRPTSPSVLPDFLHWFLNLPSTQEHLRSHARGSYVQTLSISIVRNLPVPMIPIDLQAKLCALSGLAARERELIRLIAAKRDQLLQATFLKTLDRF